MRIEMSSEIVEKRKITWTIPFEADSKYVHHFWTLQKFG